MSGHIHKKHKDRYRIQFCDQNFYITNQNTFKMWKSRFFELNDVEKLLAWVVGLSCLRRPEDWFGGKRQISLTVDNSKKSSAFSVTLHEVFENSGVHLPSKVPGELNLFDFLNNYRIKALPESAARTLCCFAAGLYPLQIITGEMEPEELLKLQISGRRVVALNENFERWPFETYAKRDFLGFVIHDLIHADHFLKSPEHRNGQLGFYRFIENILRSAATVRLLQNESFKNGFDYIISDMNAHPLHLFKTLHSLLYTNVADDAQASEIWRGWIQACSLEAAEFESLIQVNQPGFKNENALAIESLTLRLSANCI